ncbi:DNA mismatch repair protein MutS [Gordonia effusa NBRC 100432]|uniref:DNA mismatch repair protein MutS n=1 Tax=Gordonia effusa NBRC 100432 TaxID=1077974 RepID=H0QZ06_9ACTN|nr:DNA mismatch repair protein MutS [Gordonia effusa]GAB18057.1 DNA mismatch repair protein MutS [Gordonia effusa NBRC 100432]
MVDVAAVAGPDLAGRVTDGPFPSLLYAGIAEPLVQTQPYFDDLNLEPVISAIAADTALRSYFCTPVSPASIALRHSIFRDLDANQRLVWVIERFISEMGETRRLMALADKVHNRFEAIGWHLAAAESYLDVVQRFVAGLIAAQPQSAPLSELTARLSVHVGQGNHAQMKEDAARMREALERIRFCLLVTGDHVTIRHHRDERDFNILTRQILGRFLTDSTPDPFSARFARPDIAAGEGRPADLNAVESRILAGVGKLFPDEFAELERFRATTRSLVDRRIAVAESELSFYTCYRAFMAQLSERSTRRDTIFCYPEIVEDTASTWISDAYDVALLLAQVRSAGSSDSLVSNSFHLDPPEWAAIVSGPNQAGKSTFARMIGQIHHFAAVGVPVSARRVRVRPVGRIFTHFERAQNAIDDRGRLADELMRMEQILESGDEHSVVILNDTFASTSLKDARALGQAVLSRLRERCGVCVYVSAVGSLEQSADGVVSMVSAVDRADPARRTFRVERRSAPGTAYATAIAAKYRLTYSDVTERCRP